MGTVASFIIGMVLTGDVLGHIKANTASANDGHMLTDLRIILEDINVRYDFGMVGI